MDISFYTLRYIYIYGIWPYFLKTTPFLNSVDGKALHPNRKPLLRFWLTISWRCFYVMSSFFFFLSILLSSSLTLSLDHKLSSAADHLTTNIDRLVISLTLVLHQCYFRLCSPSEVSVLRVLTVVGASMTNKKYYYSYSAFLWNNRAVSQKMPTIYRMCNIKMSFSILSLVQ